MTRSGYVNDRRLPKEVREVVHGLRKNIATEKKLRPARGRGWEWRGQGARGKKIASEKTRDRPALARGRALSSRARAAARSR